MKTILFFCLLVSSALAQLPAANDLRIPQRDATNVVNLMRNLSFPVSGSNAFILMKGATVLPEVCLFSSEFDFTGNVLSVTGLPQSRVTNLVSDMSGKQVTIAPGSSNQFYSWDKTWRQVDYSWLVNSPVIPAAQVNSDWNAVSGVSQILNKPSISTGTVISVTAGTGLSGGTFITSGTVSMPNVGTAATYNGSFTTDAQGRVSAANNLVINDSPGRSIVTTTSSTGFQIDASRAVEARYDIDLSSTASIAGNASVTVFLETADTNSATPADWTTKAKVTNSQALSLAITLQSVQGTTQQLSRVIPAGKYVRIRSVISGTASASIAYSQEVKR